MGKRIKKRKVSSIKQWFIDHIDGLIVAAIYISLILIIIIQGQQK